jgi:hypothetical protein
VVLDMPIGLPPPHRHNHHIHLLPDTPPITRTTTLNWSRMNLNGSAATC